jgi:hypothetical protein
MEDPTYHFLVAVLRIPYTPTSWDCLEYLRRGAMTGLRFAKSLPYITAYTKPPEILFHLKGL